MVRNILALGMFLLISVFGFTQTVPQGISYQAIARSPDGNVMANREINMKVKLLCIYENGRQVESYSEIHRITTSQLGLFNLTIGQGEWRSGNFLNVPWSSKDVWMELAIDIEGNNNFEIINNSRLLTVPYAFHAATASKIVEKGSLGVRAADKPKKEWQTIGNENINPIDNKLGTLNSAALIIVTNDTVRMQIQVDGNVQVIKDVTANAFIGDGSGLTGINVNDPDSDIANELNISSQLNGTTLEILDAGGALYIDLSSLEESSEAAAAQTIGNQGIADAATAQAAANNAHTIANQGIAKADFAQATADQGITDAAIAQAAAINAQASADDAASEATTALSIANQGVSDAGVAQSSINAHVVTDQDLDGSNELQSLSKTGTNVTLSNGGGTISIADNDNNATNEIELPVGGNNGQILSTDGSGSYNWIDNSNSNNNLDITGNTTDFLATINNTNEDTGDGLKISLGKARAAIIPPVITDQISGATADSIRNLFDSNYTGDKQKLFEGILQDAIKEDIEAIAGMAVGVGNLVVAFINDALSLPYNISDPINSTLHLPYDLGAKFNNELDLPLDVGNIINTTLGLPYNLTEPINEELHLPIHLKIKNPTDIGPNNLINVDIIPLLPDIKIPGIPSNAPKISSDICYHYVYNYEAPVAGGGILANFEAWYVPIDSIPYECNIKYGQGVTALKIPGIPLHTVEFPALGDLVIPMIPDIDLSKLGAIFGLTIESIDITELSFWGVRSFDLSDFEEDPLTNENKFISFTDNDNQQMGSIRAVSKTDWAIKYLNPVALKGYKDAITSSKVDKFHSKYHFEELVSDAAIAYAKIGVEYTSGFGDYAEWLERIDPKESIRAGHIIGVIGGKITKDLSNAEQVMVVSHNPIVLGNVPKEGKTQLGNSVAFMGQVPVKIMGPVATGDYIVADINTPGYGFAKNPTEMSVEDFKLTVGRSWDNNLNKGPIMVNTVVGVHNGDYIKILKKHEEKFQEAESRIGSLEAQMETVLILLGPVAKNN